MTTTETKKPDATDRLNSLVGDFSKYRLLSANSAKELSEMINEAITDGTPREDQPWNRDKGWVLIGKVQVASSSGKDARGFPYTATTFAQAMVIPNDKAETSERSGDSSPAPCSDGLWNCPCGYSYHNGVDRCVKCGAYRPNASHQLEQINGKASNEE